MSVVLRHGKSTLDSFGSLGCLALIHGGAGPADPKGQQAKAARDAMETVGRALCEMPLPVLIDALERRSLTRAERFALAGCNLLEAHPRFNAGYGSALQSDGTPRVSASFMESTRQKFSAVINGTEVLHPSELAAYLQEERFCVLDNQGVDRLVRQLGIPRADLVTHLRFERWLQLRRESLPGEPPVADGKGTVGCVCVDAAGNLAAGTSTGGVGNETVGRVGDTPTVAGNFCTREVAISCTGYGEQILDTAFAARVGVRVSDGLSLREAMEKSFAEAAERGFEFAAIAVGVNRESGVVEWVNGTTEAYFVWALLSDDGLRLWD